MSIRTLPEMDISFEDLIKRSNAADKPLWRDPLEYLNEMDATESFSITEALAVGLQAFTTTWRKFPPGTLCKQGVVSDIRFDHNSGKFKALIQELNAGDYHWFETDIL